MEQLEFDFDEPEPGYPVYVQFMAAYPSHDFPEVDEIDCFYFVDHAPYMPKKCELVANYLQIDGVKIDLWVFEVPRKFPEPTHIHVGRFQ